MIRQGSTQAFTREPGSPSPEALGFLSAFLLGFLAALGVFGAGNSIWARPKLKNVKINSRINYNLKKPFQKKGKLKTPGAIGENSKLHLWFCRKWQGMVLL